MRVSDAMALVTLDAGLGAAETRPGLAAAFRTAGLPVVHAIDTGSTPGDASASASDLDVELLASGGVQTLGPAEMAIGMRAGSAFDATPLDALLRSLGVQTVVVAGPIPSPVVSVTITGAELRGYRVLLATDELAVTLGAFLRAA